MRPLLNTFKCYKDNTKGYFCGSNTGDLVLAEGGCSYSFNSNVWAIFAQFPNKEQLQARVDRTLVWIFGGAVGLGPRWWCRWVRCCLLLLSMESCGAGQWDLPQLVLVWASIFCLNWRQLRGKEPLPQWGGKERVGWKPCGCHQPCSCVTGGP